MHHRLFAQLVESMKQSIPCRNYKRYKGMRKPTCGCVPCMQRYKAMNEKTTIIERERC